MTDKPGLSREERIVLYLLFAVGLTIVVTFLSSVFLYVFWDCWPLERVGFSGCLGAVVPPQFHFLPLLIGTLLGVLFGRRFIRNLERDA